MDPVVVSYFPGAGGLRFINFLLGQDFKQIPQRDYHHYNREFLDQYLHLDHNYHKIIYPDSHTVIDWLAGSPVIYTHAMSTPLIRALCPGRRIIKIKSNLTTSLSRCWQVWAQFDSLPQWHNATDTTKIETQLNFHWDYYTKTGVDWHCDDLIDIDAGTDEFSVFMRENLVQNQSDKFCNHLKNWQQRTGRSLNF